MRVRVEAQGGCPGVALSLCCLLSAEHGLASAGRGRGRRQDRNAAADPLLRAARGLRAPAPPEFAFLSSLAEQAGGSFRVEADGRPSITADVLGRAAVAPGAQLHHMNSSSISAHLWLPAARGFAAELN